jgi:hypothetical protein
MKHTIPELRNPLHKMFSRDNILTPVAIEKYLYFPGRVVIAYLFVFGLRIARWNVA